MTARHASASIEARSAVSLRQGCFEMLVFRHPSEPEKEHVALVAGDPRGDDVLVRIHSACLTGEAFGSLHCDCGEQLDQALERIARRGRGVVVYLDQEGRDIGLANKIRAYALQRRGLDTIDANRALGLPDDARRYDAAAAILRELGVGSVRVLTNNPAKTAALAELGIVVLGRLSMPATQNSCNAGYLATKQRRSGHDIVLRRELPDAHREHFNER